jgi:hypothetical protein
LPQWDNDLGVKCSMTLIVDDIYPNRETVTEMLFFSFSMKHGVVNMSPLTQNSTIRWIYFVLWFLVLNAVYFCFLELIQPRRYVVSPQLCWSLDLSEGLFQWSHIIEITRLHYDGCCMTESYVIICFECLFKNWSITSK